MISITINCKTPSINHLYGQHGFRKYLKPEAKKIREEIKKECINKKLKINKTGKLRVTTKIYEDWFTKKGEVKRKDIANREKFLIDSIFEALNIDDKFIFQHIMIKEQSDKEFTEIILEELK